MNKGRVSVIVPVYNTAAYLPACIESVLNQTYKDFELFLIDDGSTDRSLEICRQYAQKDTRIIVLTKENGGQGSARNLALKRITGEYISFVDSDDTIHYRMLEDMIHFMEDRHADLAVCGIKRQFQNGKVWTDKRPPLEVYTNRELMQAYVSTPYIHSGPCNKVYKSHLFLNLCFPEVRANEDAYIMHEILGQCKKAIMMPEHYYNQNIRADSTENKTFSETNLILLECARRLIDYYTRNYPELLDQVVYKEVNDIAALQHRILIGGSYWKNRKVYKMLAEQIQEKYRDVQRRFPKSQSITTQALGAVQHPLRFKLENTIRGIVQKIRR